MKRPRVWPAVAIGLAVLGVALSAGTAYAQTPSGPPLDFTTLLTDPARFATELFNRLLQGIGTETTGKVADFVDALLADSIIKQTPPELSYANPAVLNLSGTVRFLANSGLAAITVWGGVNLMLHPHIRAPYHGALELVPRVVLGALLVNTSDQWGRFVIDVNNALCHAVGSEELPGWTALGQASEDSILVRLIASGIYLFMGLLLGAQMLMRLALVDALLVVAPVALLCWVLPQTYSWARLWFTTFFGTVFVQFVQVVVLQLGADLSQSLVTMLPRVSADPSSAAPAWLATLTLGIAVLQLARKVPRLMPGYPGSNDAWGPLRLFTVRQVTAMLGGDRGRPRRGGA